MAISSISLPWTTHPLLEIGISLLQHLAASSAWSKRSLLMFQRHFRVKETVLIPLYEPTPRTSWWMSLAKLALKLLIDDKDGEAMANRSSNKVGIRLSSGCLGDATTAILTPCQAQNKFVPPKLFLVRAPWRPRDTSLNTLNETKNRAWHSWVFFKADVPDDVKVLFIKFIRCCSGVYPGSSINVQQPKGQRMFVCGSKSKASALSLSHCAS